MRIIGGTHRGRKLTTPPDKNIRPTTDRMRETIFNILTHTSSGLEGARILDVFAGTGAMGLESLSRGAGHCTFFDKDRKALQLVKKNSSLMGNLDKITVRNVSAPKFLRPKIAYDVIFLDPPYELDIIPDTINALRDNGYFADHTILIAEYAAKNNIRFPDFLNIIKDRTYGDARFTILTIKI
ncbi:MAG: 16S rRNA (guanine(966)-N(2))-methyltransferase RsmD [Emcibacter sp.]|nr:16S rRNA (guanine(966)-N(2))-methyltransferase RsmD [Emcibacter sp.]